MKNKLEVQKEAVNAIKAASKALKALYHEASDETIGGYLVEANNAIANAVTDGVGMNRGPGFVEFRMCNICDEEDVNEEKINVIVESIVDGRLTILDWAENCCTIEANMVKRILNEKGYDPFGDKISDKEVEEEVADEEETAVEDADKAEIPAPPADTTVGGLTIYEGTCLMADPDAILDGLDFSIVYRLAEIEDDAVTKYWLLDRDNIPLTESGRSLESYLLNFAEIVKHVRSAARTINRHVAHGDRKFNMSKIRKLVSRDPLSDLARANDKFKNFRYFKLARYVEYVRDIASLIITMYNGPKEKYYKLPAVFRVVLPYALKKR